MRRLNLFAALFLGMLLCGSTLSVGCRSHRGYYDPYDRSYHSRQSETPYYSQWEQQNHREHKDLNQRSEPEQKQYWDWRHRQH